MRTKIVWAELHAPLFLAGTNLGQKQDPKKRTGLSMEYCENKRHLYVTYNGQTARIPETSVLSMVESNEAKEMDEKIAKMALAAKYGDAQVSTPMSHVFAGPGAGQTGQEPPKVQPARNIANTTMAEAMEKAKRGPGRPPNSK